MDFNLTHFAVEIVEFLSADTLRDIDYGVLDLSYIRDGELKEVLRFFSHILTDELKVNYLENRTGIFRVEFYENRFYYVEYGHVIKADSLCELKQLVLAQNRIWYVFDRELAENIGK